MRSKKPVYGVGHCDVTCIDENGKQKHSYWVWHAMLARCYDPKTQAVNPTYQGCSVVVAWHKYSAFDDFYNKHYHEGYALDKDLLVCGNKVYGPDTCCFVPQYINKLLIKSDASRGKYMIGVCWDKKAKKFLASCSVDGKAKHLGYSETEREAHESYCRFKEAHIAQVAALAFYNKEIDRRLLLALLNYDVSIND